MSEKSVLKGLSQEQILGLLQPQKREATTKPNSVNGPVKVYDKEMRCVRKGCSSPTYYKCEGAALCYPHMIITLNDLVIEVQEVLKARTA